MAVNLQFPLEEQYTNSKAKIRFSLKEPDEANMKEFYKNMYDAAVNLAGFERPDLPPDQQIALAKQVKESFNQLSSKNTEEKRRKATLKDSCTLYLPSGIQIGDGVDIANVELGAIGAIAANTFNNSGSAGDALKNLLTSGAQSVGDILSGNFLNDPVATAAAVGIAKRFGAGQVAAVGSLATGVTVNPNTRAYFNGVKLRSFQFNFTLIPTSPSEARQIKNIIKFFRTELYPEKIGGISEDNSYSIGYFFPNLFEITMYYENEMGATSTQKEKMLATKLLPCYLQSFSANYNNSSQAYFADGEFTETTISMTFTETRTLDRAKVEDEDY